MDISFLKTFLEVSRRRHFGKAAEALCLTQSAVSARIKLLESSLGVSLFTRTRNDIQLTPAGQRLQKHARTIVDGWEQARQCIALDETFSQNLIIGTLGDIWSMRLPEWVCRVQQALPGTAMQLESYSADALVQRLSDGLLDLVFLFDPPQAPNYVLREVMTLELMLVDTVAGHSTKEALKQGYIHVDWGTSFALSFAAQLPNAPVPALRTNQGRLALELLQQQPGSAYLPRAMIEEKLTTKELHLVTDAPLMERVIYAAYRADASREELIRSALGVPWIDDKG